MEVTGRSDYDFHFSLQSFKDELQTMDLKDWKVKLSKEREILNKVTKVVELERKRRTYVHELDDNIAETKGKQTVKMRNLKKSIGGSDTFRVRLPSSTQDREKQPSPSSCKEKLTKQMKK